MTKEITENSIYYVTEDGIGEVGDNEKINDDESEPTDLGVIQQHG